MTEEDEAFEDLAKRQGDWGMQGSRKHQIMRYAENVEPKENMNKPITSKKFASDLWGVIQMAIEEAVLAEREACAKVCDHMAERYEDMRGAALESAAESIRLRGQA
jgi:hypothetical protein